MDSSNSGSMQSSSGGGDDQEYDSRGVDSAIPISPFLNTPNNNQNPMFLSHVVNGFIPNSLSSSSSSSSLFDPLSSYLDPSLSITHLTTINPASSLLNLDMGWSKNPISDSNLADLGPGFNPPPITNPQRLETSAIEPNNNTNTNTNTNSNHNIGVVRNPKKRSRASRRAPTTVLITDTTNFRAMVQEFTGIPAPPFTTSFPRANRFDLFGTTSTLLTPPPPPPYLLRPFPQKFQQPPPFLSHPPPPPPPLANSSSSSAITSSSTTATKISAAAAPNPSDLGLLKQQQPPPPMQNLLLNISQQQQPQNPVPNFHPLLSSSLQFPSSIDSSSHLKVGVLEEFGLGHGHLNANGLAGLHQNFAPLPSSSSPETTTLMMNNDNDNNNDGSRGADHFINRPTSETYINSQRVNTSDGKVSLSGTGTATPSSLSFHGGKGPPESSLGLGARSGEGLMESWICSSD